MKGGEARGGARGTAPLRAELSDRADPALLEPLWLDLEARADASFFQSWGWTGCWLRCLPPEVRPRPLIVHAADGRVVGLACLTDRRTAGRGGLVPRGAATSRRRATRATTSSPSSTTASWLTVV